MQVDAVVSRRKKGRIRIFRVIIRLVFCLFSIGSLELGTTFLSIIIANGDTHIKEYISLLNACGVPVNDTAEVNGSHDINRKPKFCSDEHRRAIEFCSRDEANKILGRGNREHDLRPYSISPMMENRPLPRCRNLDNYLSSIKLGTRSSASNAQSGANDGEPSIFSPFDCYVPSLPPPPSKTCDVLSQYDHVIFHGDSLTRHLRIAIYMSMRGNFIKGTVHRNNLDKCVCDGQFSESRTCRTFESYFDANVRPQEIAEENLCSNAAPFTLGKRGMAPWLPRRGKPDPGESIDWSTVDCVETSYRGILVVLQGGLHFKMNATDTFQSVVQPVVTHPKFRECACVGKVRLIWLSANAQSTALDEQFPHQSRENARIFNEEIRKYFHSISSQNNVAIVDWWNMTADAQSSDGVHYLSDVNLAKAAQILYLAEHWPFPKPQRSVLVNETAFQMPRQFADVKGDAITIPEGTPLPPLSFYRQQGLHFDCDL